MTIKEAYDIIHPDTGWDKLSEIGNLAEDNEEKAKIEALTEASLIACKALEQQEKMKEWITWYKERDGMEIMTMKEVVETLEEFEVET